MDWIHDLRHYFEKHGFDVFSRFSERLELCQKPSFIFIYLSFVTLGVSFGVYLILAFFLKLKDLLYTKRTSVTTFNLLPRFEL